MQHRPPIKIVVVKNNTLGLIKWEQMVFLGNPEYGVNFAPLDFVKFAEAAGARGMHINRNRIDLQMVKDMLDESSFEANHIPSAIGRAAAKVAATLRDHANAEHPK